MKSLPTFLLPLLLLFAGCKVETPIATLKEPLLGMEFVKINRGSFHMGDVENLDGSAPVHEVTLTQDFWLGKTEVTQGQWTKIMEDSELHPEKPSPFRNRNPNFPVVSVSFYDIELFLKKLNGMSTEYRFRLPTEAEWEYACRASSQTPFSYGALLDDNLANYNAQIASSYSKKGAFLERPTPVGTYPPNQWGLFDMHGNAWEWVSDWYAPYTSENTIDPTGPANGNEKVIRGGSWYFGADNAKSSHRRTHDPSLWGFSIGFRLICEEKNN